MSIADPQNRRDYELMEAARDVLTAHQDRGFEDLDSFSGEMFLAPAMTMAVIDIDMDVSHPRHRARIFPNTPDDFALDKASTLGVWKIHTRF